MKEVWLLISVIMLLAYLFATHDAPYIPLRKREQPLGTKRKIINWYAWRGPMFVEDFENPTALPSDAKSCKGVDHQSFQREKRDRDFADCHKYAMSHCRTPSFTSEQSYRNEYWNCAYWMRGPNEITGDAGNYKQCTNNNLDSPNQLACKNNRWDGDTCNPKKRVSPVCYKRNLDQCMRSFGHKTYA